MALVAWGARPCLPGGLDGQPGLGSSWACAGGTGVFGVPRILEPWGRWVEFGGVSGDLVGRIQVGVLTLSRE